jgi:predicted ATP-grasp superfamily ATP-dependent carboligase
VILGLTRQLVGETELHARPFHYCGSIGPLSIDHKMQAGLAQLGQVLAAEFHMVGLFGVDGILADGKYWPVEINPRYTASIEILELGLGVPMMALHRNACECAAISSEEPFIGRRSSTQRGNMLGKAILFASESIEVPDLSASLQEPLDSTGRWPIPRVADVPQVGTHFTAGQPICTVFALDQSVDACRRRLIEAAGTLYSQFVPTRD